MENKKAGGEDTSPHDLDQEYELRTSAPQEEMERYYARKKASLQRKLRQINKKIKKNIYKLKKDVNDIYSLILSKPGATMFVEGHKAELWKEASDDFSQRWKEIAAEKYEVECMVHLMYDLVLREEEKLKGKIIFNTKRRATSMVK